MGGYGRTFRNDLPKKCAYLGSLASPAERGLLQCTIGHVGGEGCHLPPGEGPSGIPTRKGSERISQRIHVRASVTKRSVRIDDNQDCFCPLTSPTLTLNE